MNIFLIYLVGFILTAGITGFIVGANEDKLEPTQTSLCFLGIVFWQIGLLMILMVGCLELGKVLREKLWP